VPKDLLLDVVNIFSAVIAFASTGGLLQEPRKTLIP
jgi:hypothetical protein